MHSFLKIIKTYALFQNLDENAIESLLKQMNARIVSFEANQLIWSQNDVVKEIGIVIEGVVYVDRTDENGITCLIDVIQKNESFGESFVVSHQPLNTDYHTAQDSRILFFDITKIMCNKTIDDSFPVQFLQNLATLLARKAYSNSKRLIDTVHRTTRQRLQDYLSREYHIKGNRSFSIPLNRQELANYLFIDRSAMSKELSKMKAEGMLNYHKKEFVFNDSMPITEKEAPPGKCENLEERKESF